MNKGTKKIAGLLILLFSVATSACTKVDRSLGEGFIPDDQRMVIKMDTIYGIQSYQSKVDSFPTTNIDTGYIGSFQSPIFGTSSAGFVSQYVWNTFSSLDKFGIAPVVDSVVLTLEIGSAFGDTTKQQTFNVYELEDRIYRDSVYFSFYDALGGSNPDPLFTFNYTGAQTASINMNSPKAIEWATKIANAPTTLYEEGADSLFLNQFKGLFIGLDPSSPKDASMLSINVGRSYFIIYGRNFTNASATTVKDTINAMYSFDNIKYGASINTFAHDYTGTAITGINDTLQTSPTVPIGYMQGQGGVTPYIRFSEEFVNSLKGKLAPPYNTMVVNNARMEVSMQDPSIPMMNIATGRIGMYTNYKRFTPIVDYDYFYEIQSGEPLPYGGSINRTRGSYTVDISGAMQQMLISKYSGSRTITIGPAYGNQCSPRSIMLNTTTSPNDTKPLRVILTYTLIR